MPDDTKTANDKPAVDADKGNGNKPPKTANDKPAVAASVAAPVALPDYTVDAEGKVLTGNLTRDSIIETVRGKLVADGKSDEEAIEAGVKRGFQMVKP